MIGKVLGAALGLLLARLEFGSVQDRGETFDEYHF